MINAYEIKSIFADFFDLLILAFCLDCIDACIRIGSTWPNMVFNWEHIIFLKYLEKMNVWAVSKVNSRPIFKQVAGNLKF